MDKQEIENMLRNEVDKPIEIKYANCCDDCHDHDPEVIVDDEDVFIVLNYHMWPTRSEEMQKALVLLAVADTYGPKSLAWPIFTDERQFFNALCTKYRISWRVSYDVWREYASLENGGTI